MSGPQNMENMCQLAQNLARNRGYHVFPCRSVPDDPMRDKTPTTPHGFKDASNDPDAIARLWRRFPGDLIAIATGEASGVDVLDIDSARHKEAAAWWPVASKRIPPTRLYQTRSGGLHAYFRHADGVPSTASKLAKGVDTRGNGGYAIFWYAAGFDCEDHAAPAPWPAWLLECVLWKPAPVKIPAKRRGSPNPDKAVEGILRVVSGAREGERNKVLYWGARRLSERVKDGHIGQAEASSLLLAAACSVGLQAIEAQRTLASAWMAV